MLFIDNQGIHNPEINLAIEEFIIRNLMTGNESFLLFYINQPSIIIGKHQNTIEEINIDYVEKHNIKVIRRLSGGGAVYHDLGNLNYSFITPDDGNSFSNYQRFLKPIISTLKELGINAELKGRNDMVIGDKKISGNAQFATGKRIFTHGTLLFDSNMDEVVNSLKVKKDKIESKGIKSIRSRVANISEFLTKKMNIDEFKERLLLSIFNTDSIDKVPKYELTEKDKEIINKISKEKYANWDWNYGYSPEFTLERSKRFPIGSIDLKLNVKEGIIKNIKIFGDFFSIEDPIDIENKLTGIKYSKDSVKETLTGVSLEKYFGNIELEEFLTLIY